MENGMLMQVNQVAGLGINSNPVESTHFKFQNRIQQIYKFRIVLL